MSIPRVAFIVTAIVVLFAGCVASGTGSGPGGSGSDIPLIPTIVVEPVDDVPEDFGTEGTDYWVAKARYGNSKPESGDYELEVGNGAPNGEALRAQGGMIWKSGEANSFFLSVDSAGRATLRVSNSSGGDTISYDVGGAEGDVYLHSRAPINGLVELLSLAVNGASVLSEPIALEGGDSGSVVLYRIGTSTLDMSGGVTIEGSFSFSWDGDLHQQENPKITLKIPRPRS